MNATDSIARQRDLSYEEAHLRARKRVRRISSFYKSLSVYCVVIPFLWILNAMTGKIWWAQWPTLGWGLALCIQAMNVFAINSFFGPEWEARKVDELMARENLKRVSSEKSLVQAQMRMLQAQIEPHFLFNTLATIQSLIARSPEQAQLMLDNFIAYLRQTLSASRAQQGSVTQEAELLRHYLDLLKIRMGERLRYAIDIDPSLSDQPLAPMLLQPIVENAIKHGLEPKVDGGEVRVRVAREGEFMTLSVADDGLGFGQNADSAGTGVGLSNLRERLQLLYDGRASVSVTDAAPGTVVRIRVPIAPTSSSSINPS